MLQNTAYFKYKTAEYFSLKNDIDTKMEQETYQKTKQKTEKWSLNSVLYNMETHMTLYMYLDSHPVEWTL